MSKQIDERDRRIGQLHGWVLDRRVFIAERVTGDGLAQFCDRADVARMQLLDRERLLALHDRDVRELLCRTTVEVLQGRVVFQNPGENFEIRNSSSEGI